MFETNCTLSLIAQMCWQRSGQMCEERALCHLNFMFNLGRVIRIVSIFSGLKKIILNSMLNCSTTEELLSLNSLIHKYSNNIDGKISGKFLHTKLQNCNRAGHYLRTHDIMCIHIQRKLVSISLNCRH